MRIAYADPPYPGYAHLYPEKTEVDHAKLIARLCEYDGWALSTNENTLQDVLALCPAGVRILAWCKNNAPPFYKHPTPAWEPVLCVPARPSLPKARVRNYFISPVPSGFVNRGAILIGQKSKPFCEWVIRCLGASPSDTLDDLFPGTGVMTQTWEAWRSAPALWEQPIEGSHKKRERIQASDQAAEKML